MSQNTQNTFEEFTRIIRELAALSREIAIVEEAKAAAAADKHHERMDGYIQEEQALLLKLRGLEQHRISLQKELDWDSLTLQQILEKTEGEQHAQLVPLFGNLEQQLKRLQEARKAAEQMINVRLHELDILAARQGSSYNSGGNRNPSGASHTRIRNKYV